jgi:hypothetical protein
MNELKELRSLSALYSDAFQLIANAQYPGIQAQGIAVVLGQLDALHKVIEAKIGEVEASEAAKEVPGV